MSRTALVVIGIIALTLGAIFLIINNAPAPSSAPEPAAKTPAALADPASITAIEFDGLRLARPDDDAWTLESSGLRWPVDPVRVAALLRALEPNAFVPFPQDTDRQPPTDPLTITLHHDDATTNALLSTRPTAGRIAVEIGDFHGTTSAQLLTLLTDPGPTAWRLNSPFPGFPPATATRITLTTPDAAIELARIDRRWRVIQPIAARANPDVIEQTLNLIAAYRVTGFPAGAEPPENPPLAVTIARTPPGQTRTTESRTLSFPRDAAAPAHVSNPYPATITIDGPPHTSFSTAVRHYLATTATDTRAADVAAIDLQWKNDESRRFERALDSWTASPQEPPFTPQHIADALAFLTQEPAEPQESFSDDDVRPLLRVELLDFAGGPLDVLTIGYNADAELTVRGRNVVWLYGRQRGPALFNLPPFDELPPLEDRPPAPEHSGAHPTK